MNFYNWEDSTRQKIIKIHYRSGRKTLLSVNKIFDHDIDTAMQDKFFPWRGIKLPTKMQ